MDIVDQIRPHALTPDQGAVSISAGKLRAAADEIEALRRVVQQLVKSEKPKTDAILVALGPDEAASRAVRAACRDDLE